METQSQSFSLKVSTHNWTDNAKRTVTFVWGGKEIQVTDDMGRTSRLKFATRHRSQERIWAAFISKLDLAGQLELSPFQKVEIDMPLDFEHLLPERISVSFRRPRHSGFPEDDPRLYQSPKCLELQSQAEQLGGYPDFSIWVNGNPWLCVPAQMGSVESSTPLILPVDLLQSAERQLKNRSSCLVSLISPNEREVTFGSQLLHRPGLSLVSDFVSAEGEIARRRYVFDSLQGESAAVYWSTSMTDRSHLVLAEADDEGLLSGEVFDAFSSYRFRTPSSMVNSSTSSGKLGRVPFKVLEKQRVVEVDAIALRNLSSRLKQQLFRLEKGISRLDMLRANTPVALIVPVNFGRWILVRPETESPESADFWDGIEEDITDGSLVEAMSRWPSHSFHVHGPLSKREQNTLVEGFRELEAVGGFRSFRRFAELFVGFSRG